MAFNIPDHLDPDEKETRRFLAAKMYESGKLSLGRAADSAGLSKIAFSEILSVCNVSLVSYPPSVIIRDAENL